MVSAQVNGDQKIVASLQPSRDLPAPMWVPDFVAIINCRAVVSYISGVT